MVLTKEERLKFAAFLRCRIAETRANVDRLSARAATSPQLLDIIIKQEKAAEIEQSLANWLEGDFDS